MSSMQRRTMIFTLIMFIAISCQFSVDNYMPSLPFLTRFFHTTAATMRLTFVVFMIGAGFASFYFGILSDKIGRKKALMFALGSFLLGNLVCALAINSKMIIIGRLVQGLGTGGCLTLIRVILFDITNDQTELARLGSFLSIAISTVPAISPTIGAYIFVHLGWRLNFIILLFVGVIAALLIWKLLPETQERTKSVEAVNNIMTDIRQVMTTPVFVGFLTCASLVTTAILALMSIGPHLFQDALHLTPIQYGYLTFFIGVSMILGSYCNALLLNYLGLRNTVDTGLIIVLLSSVAMLVAYYLGYINIFVIIIPAMLYVFGADFISTNAFAGAVSTFKSKAGTATALYTSLQLLFAGTIGFAIAYLPDENQLPIGLVFFSIALVMSIIVIFFLRSKLERKHSSL